MKIGFLPLYVKMYDDGAPGVRPRLEAFYEEVAVMFEDKGVEVVRSPFCRLADEFKTAVKSFEDAEVDAIVTLHMAYSPSLECVDALTGTKLPIVVFDTTATLDFTNMQKPSEIMYCHGIHGVMDMCSLLKRHGKDYAIVAGHYKDEKAFGSVINHIRLCVAAKALSGARVAMLGEHFDGMGDFIVPYSEMKSRFGIEVLEKAPCEMRAYEASVTDEEIRAEYALDKERFDFDEALTEENYLKSLRSCLAVRKCIENEKITAFTANFRSVGPKMGLQAMPFTEACKGMQRGIGYAGECDTLTAAFTGALLQGFSDTSFVEIFCPDWVNDLLFLSHMGEVNYGIINSKPYVKQAGKNYGEGELPIAGYARMKGGKATFINICRDEDDYKLVLSDVEMQEFSEDNFPTSVRGWMKLGTRSADFLEKLSENGATHHSILVYGATARELSFFAKLIGVTPVVI